MADVLRLTTALADRYSIERELGAGGMATVYLAQDLKHDRKVAIKVLRPELAAVIGAERFLSEIKTTANLQHPHILPLHDSGQADSFLYYVMPYVEGESLRDRLSREKQLPITDSVRIATEVAGALDYAHRHGIIHRDIKPENILLHDGRALVADFGIALAASTAGTRMTETGMSLGTPHYMSPEQAMGDRELTPRSDVYALGAMTYEMLLGEPPFTGPTAQSIVAKVMTEKPAGLIARRERISPAVEDAVLTALEKLPADRFATAADFAAALADSGPTRTVARSTPSGASAHRPRSRALLVVSGLGAVAAGLALWGWLRPAPAPPVTATYITFAANESLTGEFFTGGVAPDGSALAYIGPAEGGTRRIWIKQRSELHPVPLAGTEGAANPFYSPDGRWVGFFADGKLKKIPARGGGAVTLADVSPQNQWGGWLDDGRIVFGGPGFTLRIVADGGGTSETVVSTDSFPGRGALGVFPLPGARGFLFAACGPNCATSDLWVLDLRTRVPRRLLPDALGALYVETGHLLYTPGDGTWLAAPFDLNSLSLRGPGIPVLEGLARFSFLALSGDGTLFYQEGRAAAGGVPVWVTRDGRATPIDSTWTDDVGSLALSPDGRRLAVAITTGREQNIWIKELDRGPLSRLTFGEGLQIRPAWSPDGRSVLYLGGTLGTTERVYQKRADGTGKDSLLVDLRRTDWAEASYSPDGGWLILRSNPGQSARDIFALRTGGDTTLRELVATPSDEYGPALSPDGRWLAYVSAESGRPEVYVRPFPNTSDGKYQVSVNGGSEPVWAHNGRELFFVNGALQFTAAEVTTSPSFAVGRQQVLFPVNLFGRDNNHSLYAVAPDDRRFAMVQIVAFASGNLVMVENWLEVLKGKLKQ